MTVDPHSLVTPSDSERAPEGTNEELRTIEQHRRNEETDRDEGRDAERSDIER